MASFAMTACLAGCGSDKVANPVSMETQVTVNELQSRNSSIENPLTSKKSDWVELYNPSDEDANLQGFYISDDPTTRKKAQLTSAAVVPAKWFLVLWLDDTDKPEQLSFPFKLSGEGDTFVLSDPNGHPIDTVDLPNDPTGTDTTVPDVSYGAYPDGSKDFGWCETPTQGKPNDADCAAVADAGS